MVIFRYHGNYVGPGWSAGKYQRSVRRSRVPAIDEFDQTAKEHDAAYATPGADLKVADYKFYRSNIGQGLKRSAAAVAVGLQGTLRPPSSFSQNEKTMARSIMKKRTGGATFRKKQKWVVARKGNMLPDAAGPFKQSPGFNRKAGLPRKSYRTSGASSSKSAGKFAKGRKVKTNVDKFSKGGMVICREQGGVLSATATEQSVVVGHATCPILQIREAFGFAFAKWVSKLIKQDFVNIEDPVYPANYRNCASSIAYKQSALGTLLFSDLIIVAGTTTWQNLANQITTLVYSNANETGFELMEFIWAQTQIATTPAVPAQMLYRKDLRKARLQYFCKSSLKIQNRTVNVAANDESDDVDNVPVYGKTYSGIGDNFTFKNDNIAADKTSGVIIRFGTVSNGLAEPPSMTQMIGVKKIGKAHLDPGQIKTSVENYSTSMSMQTIIDLMQRDQNVVVSASKNRQGKFTCFIFEKMIQAVATTTINSIKIAYELDQKYGAIFTAPDHKVNTTFLNLAPL